MSYSRICLETDFSVPPNIRNPGSNGLVTFTSPNAIKNQPLYANLPVVHQASNGDHANIISVPVNPNSGRTPSTAYHAPNGQSHIYNNTNNAHHQ